MKKAFSERPGQSKTFLDNYKAVVITVLVLSISSTAFSQAPDTSRQRQQINANPGYEYLGLSTTRSFTPPKDTFHLAVRDSGSIAYKNGQFWQWSGYVWGKIKGNVTVLSDSTLLVGSDTVKVGGSGSSAAPGSDADLIFNNSSIYGANDNYQISKSFPSLCLGCSTSSASAFLTGGGSASGDMVVSSQAGSTYAQGNTVGLQANPGSSNKVSLQTNNTERVAIKNDGNWGLNGSDGSAKQVPMSQGAGSPVVWGCNWPAEITPPEYLYNKYLWYNTTDFTAHGNINAALDGNKIDVTTSGSPAYSNYLSVGLPVLSRYWEIDITYKITDWNPTSFGLAFGLHETGTYAFGVMGQQQTTNSGSGFNYINQTSGTALNNSGANLSYNLLDVIGGKLVRDDSVITLYTQDLTTGSAVVSCTYAYVTNGSVKPNTGLLSIFNFGGSYQIQSLSFKNNETRNPSGMILGDSKSVAYYGSTYWTSCWSYLFSARYPTTVVHAGGGDQTSDLAGTLPEIGRSNPIWLLYAGGSNDVRASVPLATILARIDTVAQYCYARGIPFYCFLIPEDSTAGSSPGVGQTALHNALAAKYGSHYISAVYTYLSGGTNVLLSIYKSGVDNIHPGAAAQPKIDSILAATGFFSACANRIGQQKNLITDLSAQIDSLANLITRGGSGGSGVIASSSTVNYFPIFTATNTIGNSTVSDDGTTVTVGSRSLQVNGAIGNTGYSNLCTSSGSVFTTGHTTTNNSSPINLIGTVYNHGPAAAYFGGSRTSTSTDVFAFFSANDEMSLRSVANSANWLTGHNDGTVSIDISTLKLKAAASGFASLNIPSGTAPSSPTDGDMWYDGTHLYFRNSSTSKDLFGSTISLAAVGSSPNANGASISGSTLNLQPYDATHPGVTTTGSQTVAGTKTFNNSPLVPDLSAKDSSGKAANTKYVDAAIAAFATTLQTQLVWEFVTTDATPINDTIILAPGENITITASLNASKSDGTGSVNAKRHRSLFLDASSSMDAKTLHTDDVEEYGGTGLSTANFTITTSGVYGIVRFTGETSTPIDGKITINITRKGAPL